MTLFGGVSVRSALTLESTSLLRRSFLELNFKLEFELLTCISSSCSPHLGQLPPTSSHHHHRRRRSCSCSNCSPPRSLGLHREQSICACHQCQVRSAVCGPFCDRPLQFGSYRARCSISVPLATARAAHPIGHELQRRWAPSATHVWRSSTIVCTTTR